MKYKIIGTPTKDEVNKSFRNKTPLNIVIECDNAEKSIEIMLTNITRKDQELWNIYGTLTKSNTIFEGWMRTNANIGFINF